MSFYRKALHPVKYFIQLASPVGVPREAKDLPSGGLVLQADPSPRQQIEQAPGSGKREGEGEGRGKEKVDNIIYPPNCPSSQNGGQ